jgi:dienelactone hydrolase
MLSRIVCFLSVGLALAQPAQDSGAVAKKALDQLLAGQYTDLTGNLTPEAKKAWSPESLRKLGDQIKTWGTLEKVGDPTVRKVAANNVVILPVKFSGANINFQVVVNAGGQVAGLFYATGAVDWQRPPYSKPDSFKDRDVTVGETQYKLPGTLSVPAGAGPFPGVVLVQDAGISDRDATVGGAKVFRDLAEGLASRGIAVLRYEKRTRQYPAVAAQAFTVSEETVDDAAAAVNLLSSQPEVNPKRVFLLGYGLGGYVAPRIAEESGKLAGIIIAAANARPFEDSILDQAEVLGITGQQLAAVKAQAARVKALDTGDEDAPRLLGLPAAWFIDLKGYDPVAAAKKLTIPLFLLQGERDYQANMKDFALWKQGLAGRADTTFKTYPSLNHLLEAGEGKSTEAEYRKPGHVAPEVIEEIAVWVGNRK